MLLGLLSIGLGVMIHTGEVIEAFHLVLIAPVSFELLPFVRLIKAFLTNKGDRKRLFNYFILIKIIGKTSAFIFLTISMRGTDNSEPITWCIVSLLIYYLLNFTVYSFSTNCVTYLLLEEQRPTDGVSVPSVSSASNN